MLKRNCGISTGLAPLVIGLGPGFRAPEDVHAVIETNRGHNLGRVIYDGGAEPDTGVPAAVEGYAKERVLRAPADGVFRARAAIGQTVSRGEILGLAGGAEVRASIAGLLRGLVADGTEVRRGQKIGDVDPRGAAIDVSTVSDKGRAVAGGVLEATMAWWVRSDDSRL
jgi:xanthine dehydrogenase accessory factor